MIVQVTPSQITGNIRAAASKSSMQRACAAALLRKGITRLLNPGKSNDDLAALDVIQKLGARIEAITDDEIIIHSDGVKPQSDTIQCGESGLGIRMFTPIAAISPHPLTITGSGSLLTRPMDFFDEILPQLGVSIQSSQGKLPLQIKGPIVPASITVDGSLSSQFLTGLLMAYAASSANGVVINVQHLKSKPYIDLTLQVLEHFGWKLTHEQHERFHFSNNVPAPTAAGITYQVEGDWSGAAFLLVAGAISGGITVTGLDTFSAQADKAILRALMDCGCQLSIQSDCIEVAPLPLKAFHFNATDCPDLFPPLVALASCCEGTTVIEGVHRLAHKESNRALTLQEEFGKMGIGIQLQNDLMLVKGGTPIRSARVHSRHDHRIAMACATAALRADGAVIIEEAAAIDKSYPEFYAHLRTLHAQIQELPS